MWYLGSTLSGRNESSFAKNSPGNDRMSLRVACRRVSDLEFGSKVESLGFGAGVRFECQEFE